MQIMRISAKKPCILCSKVREVGTRRWLEAPRRGQDKSSHYDLFIME